MKGFRNFLMRGSLVEIAVGLAVALAFTTLIGAFTKAIVNPILAAIAPPGSVGLGWLIRDGNDATFINVGDLIGALLAFVIFMAVIYFVIVVPYKAIQAKRGIAAFADPAPVKACPACLSADLPVAASKCKYCGTDQPTTTA
jgi:large conductance mechanosensitive channel